MKTLRLTTPPARRIFQIITLGMLVLIGATAAGTVQAEEATMRDAAVIVDLAGSVFIVPAGPHTGAAATHTSTGTIDATIGMAVSPGDALVAREGSKTSVTILWPSGDVNTHRFHAAGDRLVIPEAKAAESKPGLWSQLKSALGALTSGGAAAPDSSAGMVEAGYLLARLPEPVRPASGPARSSPEPRAAAIPAPPPAPAAAPSPAGSGGLSGLGTSGYGAGPSDTSGSPADSGFKEGTLGTEVPQGEGGTGTGTEGGEPPIPAPAQDRGPQPGLAGLPSNGIAGGSAHLPPAKKQEIAESKDQKLKRLLEDKSSQALQEESGQETGQPHPVEGPTATGNAGPTDELRPSGGAKKSTWEDLIGQSREPLDLLARAFKRGDLADYRVRVIKGLPALASEAPSLPDGARIAVHDVTGLRHCDECLSRHRACRVAVVSPSDPAAGWEIELKPAAKDRRQVEQRLGAILHERPGEQVFAGRLLEKCGLWAAALRAYDKALEQLLKRKDRDAGSLMLVRRSILRLSSAMGLWERASQEQAAMAASAPPPHR